MGVPHVIPVCFAYVDGSLWISIDEKPKATKRSKRLRNIEENSMVSLVWDRYDENWARLAYVFLHGNAEVVEFAPTKVVAALRARYAQYEAMRLEERPAIRIKPKRVVMWGELD